MSNPFFYKKSQKTAHWLRGQFQLILEFRIEEDFFHRIEIDFGNLSNLATHDLMVKVQNHISKVKINEFDSHGRRHCWGLQTHFYRNRLAVKVLDRKIARRCLFNKFPLG